jgi:peptidoglycan/xylan/chitin deacetylase (PgdA/CDA1 family)
MHIVTLSFDDGFLDSFPRVAAIYEQFGLSACLNVIASGHFPDFQAPDEWHEGFPKANFEVWNELADRGHEIMPHGWKHADKKQLGLAGSQPLIERCLDYFEKNLKGFRAMQGIFNFPYNSSSPEVETWLATKVRAFRTGGPVLNPLPTRKTQRITCGAFGPGNCEADLDRWIEKLLAQPEGWLVYNTHGLDKEGWGPIGTGYLEKLLDRLVRIPSVRVLPAAKALDLAVA